MAADDRLERAMSDRLHAWLDPAAGPHPRWDSSPAALAVAADGAGRLPTRRVPRLGLLLAAAIALACWLPGWPWWAAGPRSIRRRSRPIEAS